MFGFMLQFLSTLGSTIPQPNISSHPEYLHIGQPLELQMLQETSISADGSVKGKKEGLKRILVSLPKKFFVK